MINQCFLILLQQITNIVVGTQSREIALAKISVSIILLQWRVVSSRKW